MCVAAALVVIMANGFQSSVTRSGVPESEVLFENATFWEMVKPYMPEGMGSGETLDGDDWEAMAIRNELMDLMLLDAFGEAISAEVRESPRVLSPLAAQSGEPDPPGASSPPAFSE